MKETNINPYRRISVLDKKIKPLILKWLSNLFGYENYPHSFKDQWITWNIWDGLLSVYFDLRQKEQVKLLSLIPSHFLKKDTFYLQLNKFLDIEYPEIIDSKLLSKDKHRGGSNGWYSKSDEFYTYDWEVFLNDGSSLFYHNQKDTMDMIKGDIIYNTIIQERTFVKFLQNL